MSRRQLSLPPLPPEVSEYPSSLHFISLLFLFSLPHLSHLSSSLSFLSSSSFSSLFLSLSLPWIFLQGTRAFFSMYAWRSKQAYLVVCVREFLYVTRNVVRDSIERHSKYS